MRISVLAAFLVTLFTHILLAANANAQRIEDQVIELSLKDETLLDAFRKIEKQTGYRFMYRKSDVSNIRHLSTRPGKHNLAEVLRSLLSPAALTFKQVDNRILVQAQTTTTADTSRSISGKVTGDDGQPVIGATVILKQTRLGTITNEEGNFSLNGVGENAVLVISSLGYKQMEVALDARNDFFIQLPLQTGGSRLNEVVVVGYGTQQKRELSGSIAKIGTLKPEENMVSNSITALQGRVAGLTVQNTGSGPGSMPNFMIRGIQTTQSNVSGSGSNPLIVVDGLVIDAAPSGANANFSMMNLNPQDIASIEVLKDAASSAIYGARGAQGVILITTKKGTFGAKPVVTVNSYWGKASSRFSYRPLNSAEYETVFKEARSNRIGDIDRQLGAGGLTPGQITQLQNERQIMQSQINQLQMGDTDINWLDRVVPRNAPLSNIQANVSGGSEQTSYYFSFGKYSESAADGVGKLDRYSGKLAVTQKVNRWLKMGADLAVSKVVRDGILSAIGGAINARPDTPDSIPVTADGTWAYAYGLQEHPLGILTGYHKNQNDAWNYTGNVFAEASLTKNISFRSMLAGSKSDILQEYFMSPLSYGGQGVKGDYISEGNSGLRYTANNVLTWRFLFSKLKGDAVLGQEFTGNQYKTTAFNYQGFPMSSGLWEPGNASSVTNYYMSGNRKYEDFTESYFLRSNMSWDGKYLLSASLRRDGSSKLRNNRYAWFPAVSGGWILSEEAFLKQQSLVNLLKVRGSYGITGNIRPLGLFDVEDLVNSVPHLNSPALRLSTTMGNPDLKWERTRQYDIGLDVQLLNDRLSITAEYYMKKTDGLLTSMQIPWSSGGFISQRVNLGGMENKGIDLSVSYGNKTSGKQQFKWELSAVANFNRNKVTQLRDSVIGYGVYYPGSPQGFIRLGQPVGMLQLYKSLGVNPETGDLMYEDRNKDGMITPADMVFVAVAQPKSTGGFTADLGWKGFTLNTQFAFTIGNKIFNFSEQTARNYGFDIYTGVMSNKPDWVLDRWKTPGDKSYYPRAITGPHGEGSTTDWNTRASTHYLFDGSYLRCRNITFGYDVPAQYTGKIAMQQVRLYVSAQNVFTIKDKALLADDPEQALESGIQQSVAPLPRSFSIGFDIRF
ncbi:SusC/RagA family TonB-linked outer membrane protein [uncultured Chitinophaga sp.]|uniref:SusC/RagA family TonB-linked outer membrane protein n=1 Tax=uncultured Chitinophaga sp. TaxID=339340 RepID=UPI0025EAA218|nr:SusC/RagA family TonB-linked outer membrane protein [uncultured Chitinophaga sp.]